MKSKHEQAVEEYGKMGDKERRSFRIKVFKETKSLFNGNNPLIKQVPASPMPKQVNDFRDLELPGFERVDTRFIVFNGDCIEVALKLKQVGYKTALLNMASSSRPGGGVDNGAAAQEENLFRRSDYFRHLNKKVVKYPFAPTGGVYSPNVLIVKGSEADYYPVLEHQEFMDMIAVAAIRRPPLEYQGDELVLNQADREITFEKIMTMLSLGAYFQNECLVLSALGCGAYQNPPKDIAKIFQEALMHDAFKDRFKVVAFAIFDDYNSRREHNPEGNVEPFAKVFQVPVISQLEDLEQFNCGDRLTEFEDTKIKVQERLVAVNEPHVQVISELVLSDYSPENTVFSLVNRNIIEMLLELKDEKPLVVVGDVRNEEDLMTRSDLFAHGLESNRECVYYPGISLIKDKHYALLEELVYLDLVSIGEISESDDEMRERLLRALSVACINQSNSVVFSNFGHRNPERTAVIIKDALDSEHFARRFVKVVILSNDESFERVFGLSFTDKAV